MTLESSQQGVIAGSIPLFAGHPAPELLPAAGFRQAAERLMRGRAASRLFNYGDERGDPRLRDYLVERLNRCENLGIRRENLMILGGSTGGVTLLCDRLTVAGDDVLVDAPSYRDALHIFRDRQLRIHAVPIDEQGILPQELERTLQRLQRQRRRPKFYYVVPTFQNPSGITMPAERRRAVIALSQRYRFAIIEDDVYCDIRFDAAPPPSFYALSGGAGVLRLGSFSKTLAPGLRCGWLVARRERIAEFSGSGMLKMGGGANPFTAALVAEYCASGAWERHLGWLRGQYRQRRDIALAALRRFMPPGVSWTRPEGGYFIWLRLPAGLDAAELAARVQARDVYFAPGSGFFVSPEDGTRYLRLSFSFVPAADLRAGIEILAEGIAEMAAG